MSLGKTITLPLAYRTACVERLDPRNADDVAAVAGLHELYLPDSPVVLMGPAFMRRFYYAVLVRDNLIDCVLCRTDGRVVGFLAFTAHPHDFLTRGIRRHWLQVCWLTLETIVRRPATVSNILFVLRIMSERMGNPQGQSPGRAGEALSLAVMPEYQQVVPEGGRSRVSLRLFEVMADSLRGLGLTHVQIMVQPANIAANLFYSSMGCRLELLNSAGKRLNRYICDLSDQGN